MPYSVGTMTSVSTVANDSPKMIRNARPGLLASQSSDAPKKATPALSHAHH